MSIDGGKTWIEASRLQKSGIPYIADDDKSDKWAWVLFEITAEILHNTQIIAKAVFYMSSAKISCFYLLVFPKQQNFNTLVCLISRWILQEMFNLKRLKIFGT